MKEGNIRRIIRTVTILLLVSTLLLNTALCEQTAWNCPECGRTGNTGNYCGNCAHPAPWKEVTDDKETESIQMDVSAFQKINNIVIFGYYEQDYDLNNGSEEIEWIVLDYDEKEHKALLLSKYGLDTKRYNEIMTNITWENCTLRKWLNDEFMKEAFSAREQAAILMTEVDNSVSQGFSEWDTYGGNNTQDQIFLLSFTEANRYLEDNYINQNTSSHVSFTAYAISKDTWGSSMWWLRSPGRFQNLAAYMGANGSYFSDLFVNRDVYIRPALWLDLESDIF